MSTSVVTRYETTSPVRPAVLKLRGAPQPLQYGSLRVTPIMESSQSVFGAEVERVDWQQPISEETVQQVRSSLLFDFCPLRISAVKR